MKLKDKVAVIYGAGGAVGGAVARAFAREGARLFLTGHNIEAVQTVAKGVVFEGGKADTDVVDALDEAAVDGHLAKVIGAAGAIDVSFNAVGLRNTRLQGVALAELDLEQFSLPLLTYPRSYFLTARLAARHMVPRRSGVIMTVTSTPSRTGIPMMGGVGVAMAAVEALTRGLSAELGPHGVRVVGLRPTGMPDSGTIHEVFGLHAKAWNMPREKFAELIAGRSHPRRLSSLEEMANTAAFAASDAASGLTGTTINLAMGALDD